MVSSKSKRFAVYRGIKLVNSGTFEDIFHQALARGHVMCYGTRRVVGWLNGNAWIGVDTFAKLSKLRLTLAKQNVKIALLEENVDDEPEDDTSGEQ